MKFSSVKLAGALLASVSMACAGPVWSASAPAKQVKAVAKHKAKVKATSKRKVKSASSPAVTVVPAAAVTATVVAAAVAEPVVQPAHAPVAPSGNPYLAYQQAMPQGNPYLAYQQNTPPANPWNNASNLASNLKSLLPSIPEGQSILPSIKKVYPTGEKPLVVLTFKCPTELIGITPIPTKLLHDGVNGVFDLVNATNLLSFNMQQVCQ